MKKLKFLKIKKSQNFCKNLQIKILVNLKSTPDLPPAWSAIDITGMMAEIIRLRDGANWCQFINSFGPFLIAWKEIEKVNKIGARSPKS